MVAEIRMKQALSVLKLFSTSSHGPSHVIQQFFSNNKQLGSKDRKSLSDIFYACTRYMPSRKHDFNTAEVHLACKMAELDDAFVNYWDEKLGKKEELRFDILDSFPLSTYISTALNKEDLIADFIKPRALWIRVKRDKAKIVQEELQQLNISIEVDTDDVQCWRINTRKDIKALVSYQKGFFDIQDASSQKVATFFPTLKEGARVWDVCAGSGGKTLLMHDLNPELKFFCTDNRESALNALSERFKRMHLLRYARAKVDAASPSPLISQDSFPKVFDALLLDVPCSGSGTLSRTVDQKFVLSTKEQIEAYATLQKAIVTHSAQYLESGGKLIYITCSIYALENEDNIAYFESKLNLKCEKSSYISGVGKAANTLFVAVLTK